MGLHLDILPKDDKLFLIIGIVLLIVVVRIVTYFLTRPHAGQADSGDSPRSYGFYGGAICPRCGHPFALGPLSINLGIGTKFTRCEACGGWSIVHRASPEDLLAAEEAELAEVEPEEEGQEKEAEKNRRRLDDSRYFDR